MSETYMQIINYDLECLFVDLSSGKLSWTLPEQSSFEQVLFLTHVNDEDGKVYFESIKDGAVMWSLPKDEKVISTAARNAIKSVDPLGRHETEKLIGEKMNEALVEKHFLDFENYLEHNALPKALIVDNPTKDKQTILSHIDDKSNEASIDDNHHEVQANTNTSISPRTTVMTEMKMPKKSVTFSDEHFDDQGKFRSLTHILGHDNIDIEEINNSSDTSKQQQVDYPINPKVLKLEQLVMKRIKHNSNEATEEKEETPRSSDNTALTSASQTGKEDNKRASLNALQLSALRKQQRLSVSSSNGSSTMTSTATSATTSPTKRASLKNIAASLFNFGNNKTTSKEEVSSPLKGVATTRSHSATSSAANDDDEGSSVTASTKPKNALEMAALRKQQKRESKVLLPNNTTSSSPSSSPTISPKSRYRKSFINEEEYTTDKALDNLFTHNNSNDKNGTNADYDLDDFRYSEYEDVDNKDGGIVIPMVNPKSTDKSLVPSNESKSEASKASLSSSTATEEALTTVATGKKKKTKEPFINPKLQIAEAKNSKRNSKSDTNNKTPTVDSTHKVQEDISKENEVDKSQRSSEASKKSTIVANNEQVSSELPNKPQQPTENQRPTSLNALQMAALRRLSSNKKIMASKAETSSMANSVTTTKEREETQQPTKPITEEKVVQHPQVTQEVNNKVADSKMNALQMTALRKQKKSITVANQSDFNNEAVIHPETTDCLINQVLVSEETKSDEIATKSVLVDSKVNALQMAALRRQKKEIAVVNDQSKLSDEEPSQPPNISYCGDYNKDVEHHNSRSASKVQEDSNAIEQQLEHLFANSTITHDTPLTEVLQNDNVENNVLVHSPPPPIIPRNENKTTALTKNAQKAIKMVALKKERRRSSINQLSIEEVMDTKTLDLPPLPLSPPPSISPPPLPSTPLSVIKPDNSKPLMTNKEVTEKVGLSLPSSTTSILSTTSGGARTAAIKKVQQQRRLSYSQAKPSSLPTTVTSTAEEEITIPLTPKTQSALSQLFPPPSSPSPSKKLDTTNNIATPVIATARRLSAPPPPPPIPSQQEQHQSTKIVTNSATSATVTAVQNHSNDATLLPNLTKLFPVAQVEQHKPFAEDSNDTFDTTAALTPKTQSSLSALFHIDDTLVTGTNLTLDLQDESQITAAVGEEEKANDTFEHTLITNIQHDNIRGSLTESDYSEKKYTALREKTMQKLQDRPNLVHKRASVSGWKDITPSTTENNEPVEEEEKANNHVEASQESEVVTENQEEEEEEEQITLMESNVSSFYDAIPDEDEDDEEEETENNEEEYNDPPPRNPRRGQRDAMNNNFPFAVDPRASIAAMPHTPNQRHSFKMDQNFSNAFSQHVTTPSNDNNSNDNNMFGNSSPSSSMSPTVINNGLEDQGYVNAIDLFKTTPNKPLVKIFFENYMNEYQVMDHQSMQTLCYDVGRYASTEEIIKYLQDYCNPDSPLRRHLSFLNFPYLIYEEFLIFWRTHHFFRALKVSDPLMKRRILVASLFRKYDSLSQGFVKYFQFHEIWNSLLELNYINSNKKPEDIIERVDTNKRNKVDMNRFINWLDTYVPATVQRRSTLTKILRTISPASSVSSTNSMTNKKEQTMAMLPNRQSQMISPSMLQQQRIASQNYSQQQQPALPPPAQQQRALHPMDIERSKREERILRSISPVATVNPSQVISSTRSNDDLLSMNSRGSVSDAFNASQYLSPTKQEEEEDDDDLNTHEQTNSNNKHTNKPAVQFIPVASPSPHQDETSDTESISSLSSMSSANTTKRMKKNVFQRRKSVMKQPSFTNKPQPPPSQAVINAMPTMKQGRRLSFTTTPPPPPPPPMSPISSPLMAPKRGSLTSRPLPPPPSPQASPISTMHNRKQQPYDKKQSENDNDENHKEENSFIYASMMEADSSDSDSPSKPVAVLKDIITSSIPANEPIASVLLETSQEKQSTATTNPLLAKKKLMMDQAAKEKEKDSLLVAVDLVKKENDTNKEKENKNSISNPLALLRKKKAEAAESSKPEDSQPSQTVATKPVVEKAKAESRVEPERKLTTKSSMQKLMQSKSRTQNANHNTNTTATRKTIDNNSSATTSSVLSVPTIPAAAHFAAPPSSSSSSSSNNHYDGFQRSNHKKIQSFASEYTLSRDIMPGLSPPATNKRYEETSGGNNHNLTPQKPPSYGDSTRINNRLGGDSPQSIRRTITPYKEKEVSSDDMLNVVNHVFQIPDIHRQAQYLLHCSHAHFLEVIHIQLQPMLTTMGMTWETIQSSLSIPSSSSSVTNNQQFYFSSKSSYEIILGERQQILVAVQSLLDWYDIQQTHYKQLTIHSLIQIIQHAKQSMIEIVAKEELFQQILATYQQDIYKQYQETLLQQQGVKIFIESILTAQYTNQHMLLQLTQVINMKYQEIKRLEKQIYEEEIPINGLNIKELVNILPFVHQYVHPPPSAPPSPPPPPPRLQYPTLQPYKDQVEFDANEVEQGEEDEEEEVDYEMEEINDDYNNNYYDENHEEQYEVEEEEEEGYESSTIRSTSVMTYDSTKPHFIDYDEEEEEESMEVIEVDLNDNEEENAENAEDHNDYEDDHDHEKDADSIATVPFDQQYNVWQQQQHQQEQQESTSRLYNHSSSRPSLRLSMSLNDTWQSKLDKVILKCQAK